MIWLVGKEKVKAVTDLRVGGNANEVFVRS